MIAPKKTDILADQKEDFEYIERRYKEGKPIDGFNFSGAFKHLERIGEIKMSNEEKDAMMKTIINETKEEINSKRLKTGFKDANLINSILPTNLKIECRKRVVINYLKK